MIDLDYPPCLDDPDLWYKSEIRPDDGFEYYSYILCHVDDILVIQHDSLSILERIDSYFKIKPSSIDNTDIYLGTKVKKMTLTDETWCWYLITSKYVQEAVQNCEQALRYTYGGTYKFINNDPNLLPMGYKPETGLTTPLISEIASYYQSLIGVIRWMVDIGRTDIAMEVSLLISHKAYP